MSGELPVRKGPGGICGQLAEYEPSTHYFGHILSIRLSNADVIVLFFFYFMCSLFFPSTWERNIPVNGLFK